VYSEYENYWDEQDEADPPPVVYCIECGCALRPSQYGYLCDECVEDIEDDTSKEDEE
jgi:hypothetical protein